MSPRTVCLVSLCSFAIGVPAQAIVIPNGFAATEATSSTAYPWGRGASQVRVMYVYDSSHFINQAVNYPVLVTQLRWRANGGATNPGGTYNLVNVAMSNAAVDYTAVTATFANNHGANLTTVHAGPVTVAAGAGTSPNNFYVDIVLTTPFLYDPTAGDLAIDLATDATGWVGSAGSALDSAGTLGATSRVYNLTNWLATSGTTQVGSSPIVEVTFVPAAGAATATSFGLGCPAAAPVQLAASARPILGTTINLVTSSIPAGTTIGAQMLGLTSFVPPIDLTPLGMPGCYQHISLDATILLFVSGTSASMPFQVPTHVSFVGVVIHAQSGTLSAGSNALGVLTSNGLSLGLGSL